MNRKAVIFLLKFFIAYLVLTLAYRQFLTRSSGDTHKPDAVTAAVARQVEQAGKIWKIDLHVIPHENEKSYKVIYDGHYVARIIEGCNSVSVILLFWSFIIAFKGKWLKTIWFGIAGAAGIYLFNLLRILILTLLTVQYPGQTDWLHRVVFPGMIYGFTFILWIIWVKYLAEK